MNRRSLIVGLGTTLAATTAVGSGRALQTGLILPDGRPFQPWQDALVLPAGEPRSLVAAAILSSNPHNTQPWTFHLGDRTIEVRADTERHLGSFDPFLREMWLGLGAAVETMAIMAPGLGFRLGPPRVEDLGEAGAGRVVLDLARADPSPHRLAAAVSERRTNRGSYATEPLPEGVFDAMAKEVEGQARVLLFTLGSAQGEAFAEGTLAATEAINADREMGEDGHHWFRPNARAMARHRDGVSVATAGLSPLTAFFGQMLPEIDAATSGRYWYASTERAMAASAGFGLIVVDDLDDRAGQIDAGRLWQRLQLDMTSQGVASQPVNQLPEMVDRDRQLGRDGNWNARLISLTGGSGRATFAFRFGTPLIEVPHSARRPVEVVLAAPHTT